MNIAEAYMLDWGSITPEGYNNKEAIYVFNFDISSIHKIERAIKFVKNKIIWSSRNLPQHIHHKMIFDFRGQIIEESIIVSFHYAVKNSLSRYSIMNSIEFKK